MIFFIYNKLKFVLLGICGGCIKGEPIDIFVIGDERIDKYRAGREAEVITTAS